MNNFSSSFAADLFAGQKTPQLNPGQYSETVPVCQLCQSEEKLELSAENKGTCEGGVCALNWKPIRPAA